MSWMIIGAIAAAVIILTNIGIGIVYLRRNKDIRETRPRDKSENITKTGLVFCAFVICMVLIGLMAPYLFPDSNFATWIKEGYSKIIFVLWCILIATAIGVLLSWSGLPIQGDKRIKGEENKRGRRD